MAFVIKDEKLNVMIDLLLNTWNNSEKITIIHPFDAKLINFLRDYIKHNGLCLYIPKISKHEQRDMIVTYKLEGYDKK
jgi:hypothetical protein